MVVLKSGLNWFVEANFFYLFYKIILEFYIPLDDVIIQGQSDIYRVDDIINQKTRVSLCSFKLFNADFLDVSKLKLYFYRNR